MLLIVIHASGDFAHLAEQTDREFFFTGPSRNGINRERSGESG